MSAHAYTSHFFAGLGKKKLIIFEDGDCDDVHDSILEAFPKLKNGGGYELLRTSEHGRALEIIPSPPQGFTVAYLKDVCQQAKIYVRSLQQDLSLLPIPSNVVSY